MEENTIIFPAQAQAQALVLASNSNVEVVLYLTSRLLFDGDDGSLWRNQIEGGIIFARPSTVFLMDSENNFQKLVGLELADYTTS